MEEKEDDDGLVGGGAIGGASVGALALVNIGQSNGRA